jgi:hypothetical protein
MTDTQGLQAQRTDLRLKGLLQQRDTTLEQARQRNLTVVATLPLLADHALVAPREARDLGIGRHPMKWVAVTQWVRAGDGASPT